MPLARLGAVLVMLAAAACISGGCGRVNRDGPLSGRIRNSGDVVLSVRKALKEHAASVTIRFDYGSDIFDELNGVVEEFVERALEETEHADEGDYLRYQMGGYTYRSSYTIESGRWQYTVKLIPEYYCSLEEETEASEKAEELIREFGFGAGDSEEEQIRTVYRYICENVRYDRPHRNNPYYHRCSTAYAALVQRTAACQGYCTALYRLLRSCGITCRIVTGTASEETDAAEKRQEELHAWLIVRSDGRWYGLDPTWDAGKEEYRYCLADARAFAGHIPGESFRTEEYPGLYTP